MHSTIFTLTTLLALTTALTLPKRYESHPESIALSSGVCGPLQTPLCCQIDVLGVIDLTCENAGQVHSTEHFNHKCAETGLTAQCCTLPVGGDALVCTAA